MRFIVAVSLAEVLTNHHCWAGWGKGQLNCEHFPQGTFIQPNCVPMVFNDQLKAWQKFTIA